MISISEIGGLYRSVPANLKDARTKAFADACDRQIKKLLDRAEKVKVWCAIEAVDEKYLDFLAAECRALLYDSNMDVSVKRNLIVNSQHWNAMLGTCDAMRDILQTAFPDNETVVREWFEYGGDPFFFKIATDAYMDKISMEEFYHMVSTVKNVRSLLEGIDISRNIEQILYSCGVCITESHINIGMEEQYVSI